jgi:SET domain-containing protein 6
LIELGNPADVVEIPAVLVTESVRTWYEEKKMEVPNLEERIDWWLEEGGDEYVFLRISTIFVRGVLISVLRQLPHSVFALDLSELLPDPFVSFSRLLLSPPQDWTRAREKGKPPKPKMDEVTRAVVKNVLERRRGTYPTSMEVSLRCFHLIAILGGYGWSRLQSLMLLSYSTHSYGFPLQEDVSLLESEISLNRRNAVIVRLGEKRILREALVVLRKDEEHDKANVKGVKEKRKRDLDGEKEGKKKARR